jgi:hypothetical protein
VVLSVVEALVSPSPLVATPVKAAVGATLWLAFVALALNPYLVPAPRVGRTRRRSPEVAEDDGWEEEPRGPAMVRGVIERLRRRRERAGELDEGRDQQGRKRVER